MKRRSIEEKDPVLFDRRVVAEINVQRCGECDLPRIVKAEGIRPKRGEDSDSIWSLLPRARYHYAVASESVGAKNRAIDMPAAGDRRNVSNESNLPCVVDPSKPI